jgi:hypothetical protein
MGQAHLRGHDLIERLQRVREDRAVRSALVVFLSLRVGLSLLAAIVVTARPLPQGAHEGYVSSLGLRPVSNPAEELLLEVWQRWDVLHYQRIAAQGYTDDQSSAFPPLLPTLMRLLGTALGENYLLAGVLVSNVAFCLALVCFYKLTEQDCGEAVARRAMLYLSIFPTAFFFLVPYTESVFFLMVMLFFYAVSRRRWAVASVAAGLASFTRIQGLVLIVPLTYEWLRHTEFDGRRAGRLALLIPPVLLPPAAFLLSRHLAGYPSLTAVLATDWHTTIGPPWHNFAHLLRLMASGKASANDILNTVIVVPFLALTVVSLLRTRPSYRLYTAAMLLVMLSVVYIPPPLMNLPRHILVLFPTFVFMASLGRRPAVHRAIAYSSTALLVLLTGMFVQWLWVA